MARVDEVAVAANRAPVSGFGGQLPSSPGGKIDPILRLVAEAPHGRLSFRCHDDPDSAQWFAGVIVGACVVDAELVVGLPLDLARAGCLERLAYPSRVLSSGTTASRSEAGAREPRSMTISAPS